MGRRRSRAEKISYTLHVVRGVLIMLLVAALGYGTWYVTRLPNLTITQVAVSGGVTIPHAVVEEAVRQELSGTYAGLIPRAFAYLYPAAAIESAVVAIPRVNEVTLTRASRTELALSFTEFVPFALWCDEERANCHFINESGYAFSDAPQLRGGTMTRFIIEDSPLQLRTSVLDEVRLGRMVAFANAVQENFGFSVEEVYVAQNGDVTYTLTSGAELRTNAEVGPSPTLRNLETVLKSPEFSDLTANNFQYIDLRFGNKVFVNEELAVPEEGTTSSTTRPGIVEDVDCAENEGLCR